MDGSRLRRRQTAPRRTGALLRAARWPTKYDFERDGYPHESRLAKFGDPAVYDSTGLGNSKQGHTFAASLSDAQRAELLECLKTF